MEVSRRRAEGRVTFGGEEEAEGGTYVSAACYKDAYRARYTTGYTALH